jgi:predicted secreted protein
MIKMTILAGRRPGLSHAEFRRYVTEVHGPLVRSVTEVAADIRHYHYNFPLAGAVDLAFGHPLAEQLDIVTQGWFDSVAAQLANMRHPRYLAVVRPDEGRFANESRAVMHYMTETQVLDRPRPRYKVLYFRRRRPGLARAAFQDAWRQRFAPAMALVAASAQGYVQNHATSESDHPDGANAKYFDVIDEIGLADPAALAKLGADATAVARLRSLESELLDTARTRALVTETIENIP